MPLALKCLSEDAAVASAAAPVANAEFHDQLITTAAGWKIQQRRGVPVLMIKP